MKGIRVVVADQDLGRFEAIKRVVIEKLDVEVVHSTGFDHLKSISAQSYSKNQMWHLLVANSELPGLPEFQEDKVHAIRNLLAVGHSTVVFLLIESNVKKFDFHGDYLKNISWFDLEAGCIDEESLRNKFASIRQSPRIPSVDWNEDLVLSQQLEWLNPTGQKQGSRIVLQKLLAKFRPFDNVEVIPLNQGFSGALVLEVNGYINGQSLKAVMKIAKQEDLWKTKRTSENWPVIKGLLNPTGIHGHLPTLLSPHTHDSTNSDNETQPQYFVGSSGFFAEFWDYLGGQFGEFRDWETIHWRKDSTAPNEELFLTATLKVLSETLYANASWQGPEVRLWTNENLNQELWVPAPPYGMTKWWKAKVLSSLSYLDQLASRVYRGLKTTIDSSWEVDKKTITTWLTSDCPSNSEVCIPSSVMRSFIHGDLNKSNILWWKNHSRPIFIDFATFAQNAHTLQDFATLENQIMFALLDREDSSSALGLDYSPDNFTVWCECYAPYLISDGAEAFGVDYNPHAVSASEGIDLAIQLLKLVRHHAFEIAKAGGCPHGRFSVEFSTALLWLALRSIGFDNSLSPYKRIFAVWSAARLIDRALRRHN